MTERQARRLATRIAEYWAERGYSISTAVEISERLGKLGSSPYWQIRSDMVNGLPRDFAPARLKELAA